MNSCNDNLREVFKLIDSLASINNTKQEAEQAKKFVEENWDEFRRDFESTSTKERCSTGEIERDLFRLIANVCDWKTNKDYMRIASQIMILCGYHSYEKANRFKQKIQNYLKKEIESDISDSISQVNNDLPSSNNQEMNSIPSINQDVYVVSSSIV